MSEAVSEKLTDPWRMMCLQHHHDLVDQQGPTVYCRGCGHAYRCEDLIDKGETESYSVIAKVR